ncbi:G2-specific serine/threonine protein kinase [Mortierella sp. AD094]|nr:G2-specific serine/threonine protein kinase [Mortierella sp. AD094]
MHHDPCQMEDYDALESIGSGSFGLIRKVRRKADGKILARKEIDYRKMSTKEKEQLVAEVNILKDLKHPNIVEFLERVIDRENSFIYILMEYCEGGDLASVIRRHKEKSFPIPEEFVWNIMTQLTMALHECHCGMSRNEETNQPMPRAAILHRDLKPDNVFLDANKNVKLGDFGLSRSLSNPQKAFAQTYVGTPFYMSPELISESIYDTKSDIWSLGCVIFEMCALEPPFLAETQAQLSAKIKLGRIQTLPSQYSYELNVVVRAMLQLSPRKRPTTTELLANPRIKLCKKQMENERRSEELGIRERLVSEWTEKYREREATLAVYERKLRAEEQRLREMDTVLASREEAVRTREAALIEQEKRLAWERQHLDDKRRELLLEQEKRQSAERKSMPSKLSSEPMAIDNGYLQDSTTEKPSISSATSMSAPTASHSSLVSASATLDQYLSTRGSETTSVADQAQGTWSVPRRKTGLSAGGRHSLQPSNTYRGPTASNGSGTSIQHSTSSSEAQDSGETHSNSRLTCTSNIQRPGVLGLFGISNDSQSSSSKSTQGQLHLGLNGKESRLSGKLVPLGGFTAPSSSTADLQRLRGKSKSASTLIAPMSSTSLSGMTPAPLPPPSGKAFLVPEPPKPVTSTTTSARGFSAGSSNHNSTTAPTSTTLTASNDTPMSFTTETSPQPLQPTIAPNGGSYNRPASSSNGASSRALGFHPHPTSLSSSSSAISNYTSRRSLASGVPPSVGQPRFNFSPALASTTTSSASTAAFTYSANSFSGNNGGGISLTATNAATTNINAGTQEVSTTPSKPQGTIPFGDERYNRAGTPPRIARQEEEDLRMEWDNDIPSPFIKKTYMRPPSSGPGGSSFPRNPIGS